MAFISTAADAAPSSSGVDHAVQMPVPEEAEHSPSQSHRTRDAKPHRTHRPTSHHRPQLSWDSLGDLALALPLTPWHAAKHILSQSWLLFTLAVRLYTYLGVGYKWSVALYRLMLYAMLLLPGFIRMIVFYFTSPRVMRSVPYGRGPRQRLDLYYPEGYSKDQTYPVAIFVTGGAWTIGYKAWGALLARRLSHSGVLVACLDYRNFPQGNAMQMLEDVNTGIGWVCDKCARYQGDPDNIVLIGQSAGGQLAALAMILQAEQAATGRPVLGASPAWSPSDLRAFVGVSGAYDLEGLAEHLHRRGLYKSLFRQIMSIEGRCALGRLSPLRAARAMEPGSRAAEIMPQVLLIHGTKDHSVPYSSSEQLHEALSRAGVDSTCRLVEGKTHTSFLLEGPMSGGRDLLMEYVLPLLWDNTDSTDDIASQVSEAESAMAETDGLMRSGDGALCRVRTNTGDPPYTHTLPHTTPKQPPPTNTNTNPHTHPYAKNDPQRGKDSHVSLHSGLWGGNGGVVEGGLGNGGRRSRYTPIEYPALCPAVLCKLASMVVPF